MAVPVTLAPPPAPSGLGPDHILIYNLWYYNNPVRWDKISFQQKVPVPKQPGPFYPIPFDKMQFPLEEWILPIVMEDPSRRVIVWIQAIVDEPALKYIAYATLAYLYQFPDARITSSIMLTPRATDKQLQMAAQYGLGVTIVPLILLPYSA
jgi:hypothetical protein